MRYVNQEEEEVRGRISTLYPEVDQQPPSGPEDGAEAELSAG